MSARPTLRQQLVRRKPLESFEPDSTTGGGLRRTVGAFQLTMIGIGATIGTGIFFLLGAAVPEAGPAVIVSLAVAAAAAALTALCYAELASAVPVSGSSYSYAYATLGEFAAWAVGWCLLLEYAVSGAAIAVSWGQYLNDLTDLTSMGTLAAFAVVSLGVLILRRTAPDLERRFRVPGHPVIPVLSILACVWLMYELPTDTYVLFGGWLAVSVTVYLLYSRRNSRLEADADRIRRSAQPLRRRSEQSRGTPR
ncbi:APC family permease [Streptomyces sp. NPDC053431]|uniref:APC family permease n=1 Tax=Streptomyces sp. NPDC053431 TaxID=3365703 RepID=UPI0037D1844A